MTKQTDSPSDDGEVIAFYASQSIRRKVVIWGVAALLLALGCAWFNTAVTWALAVPNILLALAMLVLYVGVLRDAAIFQYRDGTLEMGGGPFAETMIELDDIDTIDSNHATGLVVLDGESLDDPVTLPVTVLADDDRDQLLALLDRHV